MIVWSPYRIVCRKLTKMRNLRISLILLACVQMPSNIQEFICKLCGTVFVFFSLIQSIRALQYSSVSRLRFSIYWWIYSSVLLFLEKWEIVCKNHFLLFSVCRYCIYISSHYSSVVQIDGPELILLPHGIRSIKPFSEGILMGWGSSIRTTPGSSSYKFHIFAWWELS